MTILLDTAVALWLDAQPSMLSPAARQHLENGSTRCLLSVISIWEIEVKNHAGKLPLSLPVRKLVDELIDQYQLELLDLGREACHQQSRLPLYHRDPFDRLLMCQGIAEGLPILTPDKVFAQYPIRTIW